MRHIKTVEILHIHLKRIFLRFGSRTHLTKVLTQEIRDVSKIPNQFLNEHLARHIVFYYKKSGERC